MSRTVVGKPDRPNAVYRCCARIAAMVMRVLFDQKAYGTHNVPRTGGVLVVSNHSSYLDPCVIAAISPRQFAFLADSYLWGFKPFGLLISALNAFPVKQGKGDVGAVKQTIELLREGWALTLFPEGMRSPTGRMMPVQNGAALVIRRADVPVVPAFIWGAYEAWPKKRLLPKRGKIRVIYRPAMDLSRTPAKEITEILTRTFREMEAEAHARFGPEART